MKVNHKAAAACWIVAVAMGATLLAQRPERGGFGRGPLGGMFFGKTVTNEPYSGVGVTTTKRVLADGNTITESQCVKVYRDSAGRTRQEETRNSATCGATPSTILIVDPVAGMRYFIDPQTNTYRQMTFHAPPAGAAPRAEREARNRQNGVQTSLGTQPIAGTSFSAQGTQTVATIPAGRLGNEQPITITSARWYSPDLQIVVQSSRSDPRGGTTTYQLSNISTAEPDASLFQLPSGLTLQQGGGFGGRGRRAE